ncbi:hypothetical protein [Algibacter lectus]
MAGACFAILYGAKKLLKRS